MLDIINRGKNGKELEMVIKVPMLFPGQETMGPCLNYSWWKEKNYLKKVYPAKLPFEYKNIYNYRKAQVSSPYETSTTKLYPPGDKNPEAHGSKSEPWTHSC